MRLLCSANIPTRLFIDIAFVLQFMDVVACVESASDASDLLNVRCAYCTVPLFLLYLSVYIFGCVLFSLSVYLSVSLLVCLSIYLFVCVCCLSALGRWNQEQYDPLTHNATGVSVFQLIVCLMVYLLCQCLAFVRLMLVCG